MPCTLPLLGLLPLALALLVSAAGCRPPEPPLASMRTVELRPVVPAGSPGATVLPTRDGGELSVGPARLFHVWNTAQSQDSKGRPALGLEVASAETESFGDFTEQLVDEQLAIVIDAEVVIAPRVTSRLPGKLIIESGARAFSSEEMNALLARFRLR